MQGVNKAMLVGYVGKDPETGTTKTGMAWANFSIAISETWKDGNQKKERTEWVLIKSFGKLAEIIGQYVKKGDLVFVEGKIQTEEYNGKYYTSVFAARVTMLGSQRRKESNGNVNEPNGNVAPDQESMTYPEDFNDDIPF